MYDTTEQNTIEIGAKQRFVDLISQATEKDRIGCESGKYWTLAFHIDSILRVLGKSLTAIQDNCLYERLIEYRTKSLQ